jgi:hypothetical protein
VADGADDVPVGVAGGAGVGATVGAVVLEPAGAVTAGAVRVTVGVTTTTAGVTVRVTVGAGAGSCPATSFAVPKTVVPEPASPRTRSLNGRPVTISTPVTRVRTVTNSANDPIATPCHRLGRRA